MYTIPHGLLSTPMTSELSLIRTVDTDKPVSQRLPRRRPIFRRQVTRLSAGSPSPLPTFWRPSGNHLLSRGYSLFP